MINQSSEIILPSFFFILLENHALPTHQRKIIHSYYIMEYVLINKYCKTLLNYFVYPNSCFSVQRHIIVGGPFKIISSSNW